MVAVHKRGTILLIDFGSTLFMHEMFLLKGDDKKAILQALVEAKDTVNLFRFLLAELGEGIFYYVEEEVQ